MLLSLHASMYCGLNAEHSNVTTHTPEVHGVLKIPISFPPTSKIWVSTNANPKELYASCDTLSLYYW